MTIIHEAQRHQASADAVNTPTVLWELDPERPTGAQVPWFEHCRPLRILATPALLLVQWERVAQVSAANDQQALKDELRKLGRGVLHSAWNSGLQRPVVLTTVEPDSTVREWLDDIGADQEWHRGEFALWPVQDEAGLEWLLQPNVEALQYGEKERVKPVKAEERVAEFAAAQGAKGKPHLERLVKKVFEQVEVLRDEDNADVLSDEEKAELAQPIGMWIEAEAEAYEVAQRRGVPSAAVELSVPLLLTSYGEPQSGALHFDANASEKERSDWRAQYKGQLQKRRAFVLQQRPPVLEVAAKCVPAAALFVGSIFHAATGVQLVAKQLNQSSGQEEDWRRTPGRALEAPRLKSTVRFVGGAPQEIQIRISITQDVTADADAWAAQHQSAAVLLDLALEEPGSTVVSDGDAAYAIAHAVRREILRLRRETAPRLPLRFFYSGPSALALFIGAELNAMGQVRLMDFRKDERGYVQSFDLTPGN